MDERILNEIQDLKNRIAHLERLEHTIANNYGWISSKWQKDPIRFGYSSHKGEEFSPTASAGLNTIDGATVPAGEIWNVEAAHAFNNTSVCTRILIQCIVNSVSIVLAYAATVPASTTVYFLGRVTLSPGDKMRFLFDGCTAGDALRAAYTATRIDIDQ